VIRPEHVLVHAGAEEAIFNFMNAALSPGRPCDCAFPLLSFPRRSRTRGSDAKSADGETRLDEKWELDLDQPQKTDQTDTRALSSTALTIPPATSCLLKQKALIEIARQYGLLLFSTSLSIYEHDESARLPEL